MWIPCTIVTADRNGGLLLIPPSTFQPYQRQQLTAGSIAYQGAKVWWNNSTFEITTKDPDPVKGVADFLKRTQG